MALTPAELNHLDKVLTRLVAEPRTQSQLSLQEHREKGI
jgi:hypothetical protein